ncbi:phosphatase PAP2 family protein [Streptomyces beihaiensis]|uniref:Phosphatase PAP2 family protein n=1 Tax=Streptomyces beihaiensis TaxID=2984495 RepID=A0ABT3TNI3_9ACTN|nr:phosphatase PAP2 family protein [Streptomyces beihaiensis]MCX3058610.1 phosphatase PAP2 family protein [Streptomyces beihaiensis]
MESLTEAAEPEPGGRTARPPLVREFLLVAGLFLVYKLGRRLANGHTGDAFHNADHVWSLERALHLPEEGTVQGLLLHSESLVRAANTYYAAVHFPATILLLVFLYLRRPRHYVWTRRALAVLTAAALALHLTFPLAPPRMLPAAHLVDTAQVYGPSVYAAKPSTDSMANQFAAMPSLHFGWALMVAIGLIAATRSRLRWLWLAHPLLTLLVIVGTANHYWLDTIVAAALLGLALMVVRMPSATPAAPAALRRRLLPAPAHPATTEAPAAARVPAPWSAAPAFRAPPDALSASDVLGRAPIRIPVQVSHTPGSTSVAAAVVASAEPVTAEPVAAGANR